MTEKEDLQYLGDLDLDKFQDKNNQSPIYPDMDLEKYESIGLKSHNNYFKIQTENDPQTKQFETFADNMTVERDKNLPKRRTSGRSNDQKPAKKFNRELLQKLKHEIKEEVVRDS